MFSLLPRISKSCRQYIRNTTCISCFSGFTKNNLNPQDEIWRIQNMHTSNTNFFFNMNLLRIYNKINIMRGWIVFSPRAGITIITMTNQRIYTSYYLASSSWTHIAIPHVCLIIVHILVPVASKLGYPDLQPWFQIPIVVNHRCSFNLLLAHTWVIPKPKYMP